MSMGRFRRAAPKAGNLNRLNRVSPQETP
jgi:hypothetical protein